MDDDTEGVLVIDEDRTDSADVAEGDPEDVTRENLETPMDQLNDKRPSDAETIGKEGDEDESQDLLDSILFRRLMHPVHKVAFECDSCDRKFVEATNLAFHKQLCHAKKRPALKCPACPEQFDSHERLRSHRAVHSELRCEVCNKGFLHRGSLNKHLFLHSDEVFKCKTCRMRFVDKAAVAVHVCEMYQCEVCEKRFGLRQRYLRHMRTHPECKKFLCKLCTEMFEDEEELQAHVDAHEPFVCGICQKQFLHRRGLKMHLVRRHEINPAKPPDEAEPAKTPTIENDVSMDSELDMGPEVNSETQSAEETRLSSDDHIQKMVVDPIKKFMNECIREFTTEGVEPDVVARIQKSASNRIQRSVTECIRKLAHDSDAEVQKSMTQVVQESVSECVREFAQEVRGSDEPQPTRFTCDLCKLKFSNKSSLQCHLEAHATAKQFECCVCKANFASRGSLEGHLFVHFEQKMFRCAICNKLLKSGKGLRSHCSMMHKNCEAYGCALCDQECSTVFHLEAHMLSHLEFMAQKGMIEEDDHQTLTAVMNGLQNGAALHEPQSPPCSTYMYVQVEPKDLLKQVGQDKMQRPCPGTLVQSNPVDAQPSSCQQPVARPQLASDSQIVEKLNRLFDHLKAPPPLEDSNAEAQDSLTPLSSPSSPSLLSPPLSSPSSLLNMDTESADIFQQSASPASESSGRDSPPVLEPPAPLEDIFHDLHEDNGPPLLLPETDNPRSSRDSPPPSPETDDPPPCELPPTATPPPNELHLPSTSTFLYVEVDPKSAVYQQLSSRVALASVSKSAYSCEVCRQILTSGANRKAQKGLPAVPRIYHCPYCGYECADRSNFRRHIHRHHLKNDGCGDSSPEKTAESS